MKGPGLRLTLAVERRWSCPACGRKVVTDGDVTALSCACTDPPQWMKMEDPKTNPRPAPRMPDAQTLTDEDLDRLGIEPLKVSPPEQTAVEQTISELTAADPQPDETAQNRGVAEDMNSQPGGEPGGASTADVSPRSNAPGAAPPAQPPIDDFGAGLDEEE
jgi:hypothetical protein